MKVHEKKSNKEKNQEITIMEETETAHEEGSFIVSVNKNLNNTMKKAELRKILEKFSKEYDEKINLGETRPLLTTFLPQRNERIGRQLGDYKKLPNYGVKFSNSFFPYFSQKWNTLPRCFRYYDLVDFKFNLKKRLKPEKQKHFSLGSKLGNKLLTRLRVGRSHLNSHSFAVGRVD